MFQTNVVEKIKTHILHSITFFESHVMYEIMWKNIIELDMPQKTIWCMSNANTIPKAKNRISEYVILTVFPLQQ